MRETLEQRLAELRREFETGQQMLAELEAKQAHLKSSLLRISGAIQVLEEVLGPTAPSNGAPGSPPEPELCPAAR